MKKLTVLLILAMAFSIVSISFSRRGPVEGRWDNRDTDEERKWSNQSAPISMYIFRDQVKILMDQHTAKVLHQHLRI